MAPLEKIRFQCDAEGLNGGGTERLWARPLPQADGTLLFELENSPFYAKGISFLDRVEAVFDSQGDEQWDFVKTIIPGGHSTYRILIDKSAPEFPEWWGKLERLGCTYERGDHASMHLYAIDVPPHADIHETYAILERGEHSGIWGFDEGHCGHQV